MERRTKPETRKMMHSEKKGKEAAKQHRKKGVGMAQAFQTRAVRSM